MTLFEMCGDYIATLMEIEEISRHKYEHGVTAFGFEEERLRLHRLIAEHLEKVWGIPNPYDTLKIILSNLDQACGYGEGYTINFMATKLEKLLTCQEGKQFLHNKLFRINTEYGIIINENPIKEHR